MIRLLAVTESGITLGRVVDCVWDSGAFSITHIKVKRSLFDTAPLLIHVSQIVRVTEAAIVVKDARIPAAGAPPAPATV